MIVYNTIDIIDFILQSTKCPHGKYVLRTYVRTHLVSFSFIFFSLLGIRERAPPLPVDELPRRGGEGLR